MENIKILSEDKIITLSTNQKIVQEKILNTNNNSWLKDFFKEEDPFSKSKIFLGDFEFEINEKNPDSTDFENAKKLFLHLKINESVACDERLWIGLTFSKFYGYMKHRYPAKYTNNIKNKWFMQIAASKKRIFRQGVSMLWWYAYLTYDEKRENPFELTEFAFKHKDFLISLYSRNISNSKHIRLALLRALRDFENDGGNASPKSIYNGIIKYASFLGGAYILDIFSEDELRNKCYDKLIELFIEENPKQTVFKL